MPDENMDSQLESEVSEVSEEPIESENPNSEAEAEETDAKGPKHIPYDRFQEVWNERQDARQQAQQLQMQILQMQQQLMAQQAFLQQPKTPEVDPEIEQVLDPVLQKRLGPLYQKLQIAEQELQRVQAKSEAEAAWSYVRENVPDMDDLAGDLDREIRKKSPIIQKKITSDPDLVIELAEKVRLMRSTGAIKASQTTKADLKGRSRSESGGAGTNPSRSQQKDWLSMTNEEFDRENERLMRQKRGY